MAIAKRAETAGFSLAAALPRAILATLALVVLLLLGASVQAAEAWPTTRFQVFVGTPFVDQTVGGGIAGSLLGPETLDDADEDDLPHPSAVAELEQALHEAAVWFKSKKFPPPALEPLLETDDGLVYRVYLCKYKGAGFLCGFNPANGSTSSGMYSPQCAGDPTRSKILYLNRDVTVSGMGLNESGYQTLAHELMHAITANTAFGRSESNHCGSVNRWITEGIPDAIGYDIMEELWAGKFAVRTDGNSVAKRHGYRPYSISLPQDRDLQIPGYPAGSVAQGHYGTSSFWRYLADSNTRGWENLLTNSAGGPPGLFDKPLNATSKNWRKEVAWVDAWLRDKFNQGLRDMYAKFVNNFAYRLAPFNRYQGSPAEDNVPHWAGILFDECAQVSVPAGGSQNFTMTIQQLAAGCVWVETTGASGLVQVSFLAGSDDRAVLESISIGLAGTMLVSRAVPIVQAGYGNYPYLGSWLDYPQDGATKTLYVISNVSAEPQNSVNRQVTFTVSVPNNMNSARSAGALPPAKVAERPMKPSYKKNTESLARQKSATTKMVNEQMNLDKESLNPNVNASNQISRFPNGMDCPEPFKYNPCGPMMTISLGIHPGTYIAPGMTSSAGGMAGQMMGGLQAMAQTSAFDANERMQELTAKLEGIDGGEVSIAIPLVDYGYSGSFGRAAITATMSGGRSCSAIGPPDQTGMTPLTGRVTIEEYSPAVLIGSFSGALVESAMGPDGQGYQKSCGTVSGQFTSVSPFLADERTVIINDSQEQMAEDIVNSLGVPADMAYKMKSDDGSLVPQPGGGSSSSSGSGGGVVSLGGDCVCECENRDSVDELCEFFCEEEFAACDNP